MVACSSVLVVSMKSEHLARRWSGPTHSRPEKPGHWQMVLPDCWKLGWSGIEHKGGKVTGGMGSGSSREDQATPHGARDVVNWQSYEDRALATCPSGEAQ